MRHILILLIFGLLLSSPASVFAGGWLFYQDGPYEGKVVDAGTSEPIEGAAVVAVWYINEYGGAGGSVPTFFNAKETLTNENGEFKISMVSGFHWWPLSALDKPRIHIFKPNYSNYKSYHYTKVKNKIPLSKVKTKRERVRSLSHINVCTKDEKDKAVLSLCVPPKKITDYLLLIEKEENKLKL